MKPIEFLDSWDGWFVLSENNVFDNIEEVYEYYYDEREDDDLPEYVHVGIENRGLSLDAATVLENYLDGSEHHETNYDLLDNEKGIKELQILLDEVCRKWSYGNRICTIWEDANRAVKLDWDMWKKSKKGCDAR